MIGVSILHEALRQFLGETANPLSETGRCMRPLKLLSEAVFAVIISRFWSYIKST